jgi:hypothetical protein
LVVTTKHSKNIIFGTFGLESLKPFTFLLTLAPWAGVGGIMGNPQVQTRLQSGYPSLNNTLG